MKTETKLPMVELTNGEFAAMVAEPFVWAAAKRYAPASELLQRAFAFGFVRCATARGMSWGCVDAAYKGYEHRMKCDRRPAGMAPEDVSQSL